MAYDSILSLIEAEISRLTQVRILLANTGKLKLGKIVATKIAAGKAAEKVSTRKTKKVAAPAKTVKKRVLSPEARTRIADAQRKRWAKQKSK